MKQYRFHAVSSACTMAPTGLNIIASLVTAFVMIFVMIQFWIAPITSSHSESRCCWMCSHSPSRPPSMADSMKPHTNSMRATFSSPIRSIAFSRIFSWVRPMTCRTMENTPPRSSLSGIVMPVSPA